jgi:histidinol phosphatase-like enzyme
VDADCRALWFDRDGTLITQRLHFAPSPHPFRHVLGWYNLAKELNDNNISAVCIFDGNLRTKAKALEVREIILFLYAMDYTTLFYLAWKERSIKETTHIAWYFGICTH